jgi:hypothetical protein
MLLLPAWKTCLENANLAIRLMPCDVATRWNSTYDMLTFAVEHRKQIGELTSDISNNLRSYELMREEWKMAEELRDTLKVSYASFSQAAQALTRDLTLHSDLERHNRVFLSRIS